MGYTLYDALINWDLSSADKPSDLVPGLATSWRVDDADKTRWIFKLREGVKFHDGSDFNADAVVWNFDKILNDKAPQFDPTPGGAGPLAHSGGRGLQGDRRLHGRDHHQGARRHPALPDRLDLMSSPAQWEKVGTTGTSSPRRPSGTGPWRLDGLRAARARRAGAQQGLLGPGARAEARQAGAAADARSRPRAPRRCARARSTGSRRRRPTPCRPRAGRLQDRHQRLSAQLDLAPLSMRRRLALERRPRAQGRQSRDRPRRHEGAARRPDDPGRRLRRRPGSHGSASPTFEREVRPGGGEEAARRGRLRHRQAAQARS